MNTIHYDKPIGMTGTLPSGVLSDHAVTKSSLEQRKLHFIPQDTEPLDFSSIWSDVLALRMPQTNVSDCLNHLANAMSSSYRNEEEFDKTLFSALLNGLGASVTLLETITTTRTVDGEVKKSKRHLIAINNLMWSEKDSKGFPHECAIAFATQVTSKGDLGIPEGLGCARSSRRDHSCVLISRKAKRKNGTGGHHNWKVRESLASVELKRQKQSFLLKKTTKKRRTNDLSRVYSVERINSPLERAGYGALWQAIAYTISDGWTCLARRGARIQRSGDDDEERNTTCPQIASGDGEGNTPRPTIPSGEEDAVEAAMKPPEGNAVGEAAGPELGEDEGEDDPPPSHIPFAIIACAIINDRGEEQLCRYAYGHIAIPKVCGERFSFSLLSRETFDGQNVTNSVNAAVAAYIKVLSFGVSMGISIMGRALSYGKNFYSMAGRELHLFDKDVTESFKLFRSPISTEEYGLTASQGEIWQGGLESVPKLDGLDVETFKFADFDPALSSLLVKCPSIMVHNPLVGSSDNWTALSKICSRNAEKSINKVLLYAEKSISAGSVKMLMRDLSSTHQDLRPSQHKEQLPKLWGLFCELVRSTLLVLAELGIVHPDMRPGYDFTSNILLHLSSTDEAETTEDEDEMVLIDLDSLIHLASWKNIDSPAYLNMVDQNPYSYVWWQCFAVAVMWKQEKNQDVNPDGGFGYPTLQNKFDLMFEESECTAAHVESLLMKVYASDWFGEQQLTDERVVDILDDILLPLETTGSS